MKFKVKTINQLNSPYLLGNLQADFYLSDLAYVVSVEELKMTGWDLVDILSEHFAFLLKMSLASFVEIVELISSIILISFGWKWKRDKTNNDSIREKASMVKMASVPNAVLSHSKIVFWLFVFLSFANLCLYLIQGTVVHYLSYPVATELKRETNLSTQVGFCNNNILLTQYAFDLLKNYNFNINFNRTVISCC